MNSAMNSAMTSVVNSGVSRSMMPMRTGEQGMPRAHG
jgi:hypothetical protein